MSKLNLGLALLVLQEIIITLISGNMIPVFQEKPDLAVPTAKLIKSCYGDRIKEIGVAGNVSDSFIASLSLDDPISIVLLKSDENAVQNLVVSKWDRYKLNFFAIAATSLQELQEILVHIKNSRWWNHMAKFYIFDSRNQEMGCSEASGFLWTAWMMDLLGAKFICNHGGEGKMIYMFNPYTKYAPAPWKLVRTQKGVNNHQWTLFVRKFSENVNMCKNVDFDQTRDAGGYKLRVTSYRNHSLVNPTNFEEFTKFKLTHKMLHTILRCMNVTYQAVLHLSNESFGFVDEDGKGYGLVGDLVNDRSDIMLWPWPLTALTEILGNYPILNVELFAVTQYTGYPTQWEKVISAIDYFSRLGVCIVAVINVIFLKYALRQSFMTAILNTVRMVCNSCFTKLPDNMGPRLYLACLFFFVVTIQALYQGQLSALLAKQVRYPNVNNQRDLIQSHYIVYGRYNDNVIFTDPAFKDRFIEINPVLNKCTDFVLNNSSIACVTLRDFLIDDTVKSKLHMSKYSVAKNFVSWANRKNWPLQDRFTRHNLYYTESGLFGYHQKLTFENAFRTIEANENKDSDKVFKILTVEDLDFAFVILGFGLGCATLTFLFESLIFRRGGSSREKARARPRHRNRAFFIEA